MKTILVALVSAFIVIPALAAQDADQPAPAGGAEAKQNALPARGSASATTPAAPAAAESGSAKRQGKTFTGEAKKLEDHLTALFDQSRKTAAPGAEGRQAREAVGNSLDWDRVAKDCLGAHWKSASEKNRNEFRRLLREVVEKTAYSRLAAFWKGGTTYIFKAIDVKGPSAHVVAEYNLNGDIATLDYYLEHKGNEWKIYDIAYEGLRYSKNINEQIEAFLKEKGFPNLLTQLRKRLDELNDAAKSEKGR